MVVRKINGLELQCYPGDKILVQYPTDVGIKEGCMPWPGYPERASLPYRDKQKPVWYVNINNVKCVLH